MWKQTSSGWHQQNINRTESGDIELTSLADALLFYNYRRFHLQFILNTGAQFTNMD